MKKRKRTCRCIIFMVLGVCGLLFIITQTKHVVLSSLSQNETIYTEEKTAKTPKPSDVGDAVSFYQKEDVIRQDTFVKALACLFAPDGFFDLSFENTKKWYLPYETYLSECKLWEKTDTDLVRKILTGHELYEFIDAAGNYYLSDEKIDALSSFLQSKNVLRDREVDKDVWWSFFLRIAKAFGCEERIIMKKLAVYCVCEDPNNVPCIYTDVGLIKIIGLDLKDDIDQNILGMLIGDQLLCYFPAEDNKLLYENALVTDVTDDSITFFYDNMIKTFYDAGCFSEFPKNDLPKLCDITLLNGQVKSLKLLFCTEKTSALYERDGGAFLEGYGFYPYASDLTVFHTAKLTCIHSTNTLKQVISLFDTSYRYVIRNGQIVAVIDETNEKNMFGKNIRVLIKNDRTQGNFHESVSFSSPQGVVYFDPVCNKEIAYEEMPDKYPVVIVKPKNTDLPIYIASESHSKYTEGYFGRIILYREKNGQYVMVNELPIDEYLYDVVPGEMPASFGLEAGKAQAVCARTYAVKKMETNHYAVYGAHLDDSNSFQVYHHSKRNSTSTQAVDETKGQILYHEGTGDMVSAYYFSTSCGVTTNASIWITDPNNAPFLKEKYVTLNEDADADIEKLKTEEGFREFMDNPSGYLHCVEKDCSWFRWETSFLLDKLSDDEIGKAMSVMVVRRDAGGVVTKLQIVGSNNTKIIDTQSEIRRYLGDRSLIYTLNGGKTATNRATLPSGFFYLDLIEMEDGNIMISIHGGGLGHGLGLSQNGAYKLAKQGKTYKEILSFFYEGSAIKSGC